MKGVLDISLQGRREGGKKASREGGGEWEDFSWALKKKKKSLS